MLERFTERGRQVVVLAHEEARSLRHNYLGTEHILLGLLREKDGLAARVLESLDITVERVRAEVVRIVGPGEELTSGQIPFTPRATKVLQLALKEALSLGEKQIDTEHILLGLVRENEGVAARILLDFEAGPERIRDGIRGRPPAELGGSELGGSVIPPEVFPTAGPDPGLGDVTASRPELGWRGRPIGLAALGAAVLARRAFDSARTAPLEPLEMQVLAYMTLELPDTEPSVPGDLLATLIRALACDPGDLYQAVDNLSDHQLVNYEDGPDGDQRISITAAGVSAVERWLANSAPLFGAWPPDHPAADDATG